MEPPEEQAGPSRVGEVLGDRWRLVDRLGGGGMGEVYRAVHLSLGRTVAIKVLRPEHAWNTDNIRRVLREGQAASRVVHPNIVRIEDVGVDARGLPYLVQEFLDGIDLDAYALTWRGVVPARELLVLMIPALDALGALHDAGILHRDLKPGNVFLVREGARWSPRLLDFGLASVATDLDGQPRITGSTVTLGSPAYMSPEQFRDPRTVTPRSDLWSVGVMLYELLTGVLPFSGATVGAVAIAVATEEPVPVAQRAPTLAPPLAAMVMRCLEKDPARRPASVRELIAVCEAVLHDAAPAGAAPDPATAPVPAPAAALRLDSTRPAIGPDERHPVAPPRRPEETSLALPRDRLLPAPVRAVLALAAVALAGALTLTLAPRSSATLASPEARPRPLPVGPSPRPAAPPPVEPPPVEPPPVAAPVESPAVARRPSLRPAANRPTARLAPPVDAGPRVAPIAPPLAPVVAPVAPPVVAPVPREPFSPLGVGIDPQYR